MAKRRPFGEAGTRPFRKRDGPLGDAQDRVYRESTAIIGRADEVEPERWPERVLVYMRNARGAAVDALAYATGGEPIVAAPHLAMAIAWEMAAQMTEAEWRAQVDAASKGEGSTPLVQNVRRAWSLVAGLHPLLHPADRPACVTDRPWRHGPRWAVGAPG